MRSLLLGCVLALGLAGAACGARTVTVADVARFDVGVATRAQVIHRLGKPMDETAMSDGSSSLTYTSFKLHRKAVNFVPVVRAFVGGSTSSTTVVIFYFGPNGVLTNTTSNVSRVNCSTAMTGMHCR